MKLNTLILSAMLAGSITASAQKKSEPADTAKSKVEIGKNPGKKPEITNQKKPEVKNQPVVSPLPESEPKERICYACGRG